MVLDGLRTSIIGRAEEKGCISIEAVNIRDYTLDRHKKVDDYTYGGGAGMLMQAQPVYDCWKALDEKIAARKGMQHDRTRVIYVTPQGKVFNQKMAADLAGEEDLIFLCGHYEGIDERVLEEIVTDYISIGDYVLTGGELPAMVMIDAVSRLVPGVLSNDESAQTESHSNGLLEYPQYSRPEVWHEKKVPDVLLSGHHAGQAFPEKAGARRGERLFVLRQPDWACDRTCQGSLPSKLCGKAHGNWCRHGSSAAGRRYPRKF